MRNLISVLKKSFRDRLTLAGVLIISSLGIIAIFAPYMAPYPQDVSAIHLSERFQPPSLKHFFGTDHLGRDLFSRVLFGARVSLLTCTVAIGLCILMGVPIGLFAAFREGWVGELLMRTSDVFLCLPRVVLALALATALGRSLTSVILALSITYWPWFSRVVYAEALSVKKSIFIEANEALGAKPLRTIYYHVLPNIISPIIIRSSIGMGYTILTAAMLGFLGVGAPPPTPEWGVTISQAREYLPHSWWFSTFPGLAIFVTVMGFNMLGDGLRDILDPRLRKSGKEG